MNKQPDFQWDDDKDRLNQKKHNVSFSMAQLAFIDEDRILLEDLEHSVKEQRYYCIGMVNDGILTVRFTYRNNIIRIIGAGYWRKGKKLYEEKNNLHR